MQLETHKVAEKTTTGHVQETPCPYCGYENDTMETTSRAWGVCGQCNIEFDLEADSITWKTKATRQLPLRLQWDPKDGELLFVGDCARCGFIILRTRDGEDSIWHGLDGYSQCADTRGMLHHGPPIPHRPSVAGLQSLAAAEEPHGQFGKRWRHIGLDDVDPTIPKDAWAEVSDAYGKVAWRGPISDLRDLAPDGYDLKLGISREYSWVRIANKEREVSTIGTD